MNKLYIVLRSIRKKVWLIVLTLFLVTAVIPAVATEKPTVANIEASQMLVKGKEAYDRGLFAEASQYWQLAQQEYKNQKDTSHEALSLNYLAVANQELGQWDLANRYLDRSLKLLEKSKNNTTLLAQVLNTQGSLHLAAGKSQAALDSWQQAEAIYRNANDNIGILGSQINQAQALQQLGLYGRSRKQLASLKDKLNAETDPQIKAIGLRSLGNALQVSGDLEQAQSILKQSLTLAQQTNSPEEISAVLFSLGNTARGLKSFEAAIAFYEQSAQKTANPLNQIEAQLNQLSLLYRLGQFSSAKEIIINLQSNIDRLAPSRRSVYAQVNLAKNIIDLQQASDRFTKYLPYTQELLLTTIDRSQNLQDLRAESYSLGTLGHLYETEAKLGMAEKSTEKALNLANRINANDIAYQWQWQLGRLLQQQGDIKSAIAAETEAVNSLQTIRGDLVATNLDAQYSFRESVEPIYRDLVGLLVSNNPSQENLIQARETIESLQLAELENYFREACIDAKPQQIDGIDNHAAVVYPIILKDRLGVIVSLPNQPLDYHQHLASQTEIEQTIEKLFQSLNPFFSNKRRMKYSQQVYDWTIKPVEAKLQAQDIDTLVFVLDGSLRNLPMAALYDGEKYLIEKYNVALTPGLQLLDPTALKKQKLEAVVAGVSESNQGFSALPGVKTEVKEIARTFPSQLLLDRDFTSQNFREQLENSPSPLIHLATHGQFSSNPEETFIVTWGDRIKVKDLENILQTREESLDATPIELLVLSACQTAEGDKRAALGIAGIAVRSGARSTLATLWSVEDNSTVELMEKFYKQLATQESSISKAKALREAQMALMHSKKYSHPYYWSPFILVGNWL